MTVPVFINDRRIEVPPGTAAIAAATELDPDLADAVAEGRAYLTDGRGIRFDPTTILGPGAIVRIVKSARKGAAEPDADA